MSNRLKLISKNCIGCKSCELACSVANSGEMNLAKSRIKTMTFIEGKYPLPYNFISTCRQCRDAPCLTSCPVGAISVNAGKVVVVDQVKCIGCGKCVSACPFGAMLFEGKTRKAYKCELCAGKSPACAGICPAEAIEFKDQKPFNAKALDFEMKGYLMLSKLNKEKTLRTPRNE